MSNNDQFACYECNRIKSLFKQICSADVAEGEDLNGSEYFPITTSCGLRKLSLGTFAQLVGGGGGGGVPSHSLMSHNDTSGNPNNGEVLVYNNGSWNPQALGGSTGWELTGNFGTDVDTDFVGTTDNKPLIFRMNNNINGIFSSSSISLGTNALPALQHADPDYLTSTVAIGGYALGYAPEYGGNNIAIGSGAMQNYGIALTAAADLITGYSYIIITPGDTDFTAVGAFSNLPGTYFFASGPGIGTGFAVGVAYGNTVVGWAALSNAQIADSNTAIGSEAGAGLIYGKENIFIGKQAGQATRVFDAAGNTEADDSIFIGSYCRANDINETNQIVIGHTAVGLGSNTTVIGNADTVLTHLKGSLTIGDTVVDASAIVELTSTTQGFLPPRMTAVQAEAISSPAEGLLVYATDGTGVTITTKGWWGYEGATWVKLN